MANITLDARQQQKHDTSTNFNNANKLYLEGEFLVETDTGKVKIGDGTLGYKSLPYTIGTRVPEGAKFTDTTYTAGTGLSLNGTSFSISNSGVTAGSYGPSQDSSVGFGDSIDVPYISVNSRGQITSADSRSITLPAEPTPASIGAANKIHTHPTRDVFKNATDNWAGSVSAIDVPKINSIRSPKSAFLPANCITVEYSSNGGSTWSDYGLTDVQKQDLFALSTSSNIKLSKSSPVSTNDCVRITIEPLDRYVSFDQLYVWFSTGSHTCALDLERSTIGAKDTFSFIRKDVPLGGWSGPNVINFPYGTFGGGTSQTNNAYKYRITFKTIKLGSSTQSPTISDIRFYGENAWIIPNDMVKNDYPFSWDRDMNVNFPKQLKEQGKRVYSENNKPTPDAIGAEPAFTKNTAFNKNFGTTAGTVCQGNDSRLSNARPASDVSAWAKAATKPTYTPTEVGVIGTAPTSGQVAVFDGTTGKIKSTGFTIASSVPAGAKFTDTTYSKATDSSLGLVQVGYETSGKNYAVTLDASGNAYVNVPWTDTNTTYSQATSGTLGLIKIGYTESGKNYPVELNSSGQAFVNVPWTDSVANNPAITITQNGVSKGSFTLNQTTAETIALTDTTYSVFKAATSSAAGGTGLVPAPDSGEQTSFLRGDGTWAVPAQPTVNNPTITIKQAGATKGTFTLNQSGAATIELTDNNTTYAQATSTVLGLVKIGYAENGRNYPIELDSLGKMFVNVPWTDTTYSLATVSANGLMPKIPSSSAQYLNGMGQWSTPPDTKYTNFVGSGSEAKSGLVPSPGTIAGTTKYLREDGTWSVPPDTTYIAGRAIEISQGAISVTNSGVSSGAYGLTDSTSVNIGTSFTVPGFVVDQYGRLTQAYSKTVTVNAPNMTGATTSAAGTAGLVPTPTAGKPTRYLCSTGEWSIPTGTIYNGSTTISVKPSTTDGEYNIYLVALFPGTTSQSVGPSASGTIDFGSAFNVPYITIDQYGRITALANRSMILSGALASSSAPGLCPKLDSSHPSYYLNANGSWSLPTGRVYGVKGEAETDYREGQVNITAANVGALALTGGTVSGSTTFSSNVTINGELNYDDGFY